VGHSAGVFDEEKLAWVNRHYLKSADPEELARLVVPFFIQAGIRMAPEPDGLAFLASAMPMATSVDRLSQMPARLGFLFEYSPARSLDEPELRSEFAAPEARGVVESLAALLADAPPLIDRERFRALANEVKVRTGQKGKALFHPIRIALTGRSEGPELDLAVPAIDRGAQLPRSAGLPGIMGNRDRAAAFAVALKRA